MPLQRTPKSKSQLVASVAESSTGNYFKIQGKQHQISEREHPTNLRRELKSQPEK